MQPHSFKTIWNSDLPISFRRVRLELARDADHPDGARGVSYTLIAPLTDDGHIDAACWKKHHDAYRVVRAQPGVEDMRGHLARSTGGGWILHYDVSGNIPDELGFHFQDEAFVPGEYVSVVGRNGTKTFKVVAVAPL